MPTFELKYEDIDPLLEGLAIFGTGGGGSPAWGTAILKNDFANGRLPRLIDLAEIADDSTVVTKIMTGKTARTVRSAFTEIWEKEGPPPLPMPHQAYLMRDFLYAVIQQGKTDILKVVAGQGVGLIKEIRSVHQVVDELVQGAIEALKKRLPHDVTM